jgi:hypothetical protein
MNVDIWQRWTVGTVTTRGVVAQMLTSDMGQSRHFGRWPTTSGLPLETDIAKDGRHVSKVPRAATYCQVNPAFLKPSKKWGI